MKVPTTMRMPGEFQRIPERLFTGYSWVVALIALFLVVPLTLWFVWRGSSELFYNLAVTLFTLSFAWNMISTLRMFRSWRKAGLTPLQRQQVLSGPRPTDPDELLVWKCAWQWMFGIIATILCLIGIPIAGSFAK